MIERCQQHAHMCQIELVRQGLAQFVTERVHARNRSFVGQGQSFPPLAFRYQLSDYQFAGWDSGFATVDHSTWKDAA